MALYYFDASAVVKYYVLEPGSTWIRNLVDAHHPNVATQANIILISDASISEGAAAFAILQRVGRISARTRDTAYRAFLNHVAQGALKAIPLVTADFHRAAALTQVHPLKAYDAVQLAVALRHRDALLPQGRDVTFVSGDTRLVTAAEAEGFRTENPFEHVSPADHR